MIESVAPNTRTYRNYAGVRFQTKCKTRKRRKQDPATKIKAEAHVDLVYKISFAFGNFFVT